MSSDGADEKPAAPQKRRIKVEDNLFVIAGVYYYRKGSTEVALGKFRNVEAAREAKYVYEAKKNTLGIEAFKFRAKDIWPDYLDVRRDQWLGKIPGRRQDSPRTFHEIDSVWKIHLRKFFGNKKLAEIDDPLWTVYCDKAKVADLTNHRKVLKTFLKWCMKKGYIRALPILDVPKVIRRKRRVLPPEQTAALLRHSHGRLLLFVSLYLFMGIRWTEIQKLAWASVNLWKRVLIVKDETTRTRKGRPVPINRFVVRLLILELRRQRARELESPWVFPHKNDPAKHMTDGGMRKAWSTAIRHAKLTDVTPHDLRATFEYYANKRADFTDTQRAKMAGASIEMQRSRYVTFEADDLRGLEEVVKFNGLEEIIDEKRKRAARNGMGKTRD